jgi:hypothetical protein
VPQPLRHRVPHKTINIKYVLYLLQHVKAYLYGHHLVVVKIHKKKSLNLVPC